MPKQICVDANLVVKLVLAEPNSVDAQAQWKEWLESQVELVAPHLMIFEGVSAIRLNVTRKLITAEAADIAFRGFMDQVKDVRLLSVTGLHERAWILAKQLNHSQVYDAFYLALAENRGCEFWTADDRLYASAHRALPWVKHIARGN